MKATREPATGVRETWARVKPLLSKRKAMVSLLIGTSLATGFLEAGALVLVTQVAFALTQGTENVEVHLGILGDRSFEIGQLLWLAACLGVARLAVQAATAYVTPRISADAMAEMRQGVMAAYLHATWSRQALEREGHFQELVGAITQRAAMAIFQVALVLTSAFNLVALLVSAVVISPLAALVVAVAAMVLALAFRPLVHRSQRWSASQSAAHVQLGGSVSAAVRVTQEIRVNHVEDEVLDDLDDDVAIASRTYFHNKFLNLLLPALFQGVALLLIVVALGAVYALGLGDVSALGATILILFRALNYAQGVQSSYQSINDQVPNLAAVQDTMRGLSANVDTDGGGALPGAAGLKFDSVCYAYDDRREVFDDLSFEIQPGECIGIVGPSGAGKSTLVQLLLRLRRPQRGTIRMGGEDIRSVRSADWFRSLSYVPQDPLLLDASVRENIRFKRDWIDDGAVEAAAQRAHIHEEILALPEGYETIVGPRARSLSGGQRQRLCWARGLASKPQLLVLDEPTSALDLKSEAAVQGTLEDLKGRVTLVIVAHRVSTLNICDRIMVLEGGQIKAFLPQEQLVYENEFFRQAVDLAGLQQR